MPSTNTMTISNPNAPYYEARIQAFWFVDGANLHGPLGQPTAQTFSTGSVGPEDYVRSIPGYTARFTERDAGHHHPNIFMGSYDNNFENTPPVDRKAMVQAIERSEILQEELRNISRVVTPTQANATTFGSRIRNLLIMACTDVEAHCKAILGASNVAGDKMKDYVRIAHPLRLADYTVSCDRFPNYPDFPPFAGWSASTRLPWYQAYNKTKHDAVGAAHLATLEHAISAVAAADVLVLAQYGSHYLNEGGARPFFRVTQTPNWEAHERNYKPPSGQWLAVPYLF